MRNWTDTWFCGVQCSQYYVDFLIWEKMLNRYEAARIIEIGTLWGGFGLYLCAQAIQRGMDFQTFDIATHPRPGFGTTGPIALETPLGRLFEFEKRFHKQDVFEDDGKAVKGLLALPGRSILLCDGGNKPREFGVFAPFAKEGDIIVVHDWGTEIRAQHVNYSLVDEIMTAEAEKYGSLSRFFMRRVG